MPTFSDINTFRAISFSKPFSYPFSSIRKVSFAPELEIIKTSNITD